MALRVGIDLGTTFSSVAYVDKKTGLPNVIPNMEGDAITPSIIWFHDGTMTFGTDAYDEYRRGNDMCAASFKRDMGSTEPFFVGDGHSYTPEDLSSLLLRHLKEDAEQQMDDTITEAVITVPAYFYSREREATIRAAERAGLKVTKIIDEPNAAAMAYGMDHWRENASILVYDLGGGTFDVTLTQMGKGGDLESIVTRGDHLLGGKDWDERLCEIIASKVRDEVGDVAPDDEKVIDGAAEGIKRKLSSMSSVTQNLFLSSGVTRVTVTRDEFEDETRDLLDMTIDMCRSVLDEAGMQPSDLTDILLVGGSTRMPQVSDALERAFGIKPIKHVDPDKAVSLGAAIQVEKENPRYVALSVVTDDGGRKRTEREGGKTFLGLGKVVHEATHLASIGDINLRETTAHAMGVVAIDDKNDRYVNDVIIPANHPRPVKIAKRFMHVPKDRNDDSITVYVTQGSSDDLSMCQVPYRYVVSGIDCSAPFGTPIRIQYCYDDNGVISVRARQKDENRDLPIRREDVETDVARFMSKPSSGGLPEMTGAMRFMLSAGNVGGGSTLHMYDVTFSNGKLKWRKYDNVDPHDVAPREFNEPKVHVIANDCDIEFHGYNVSRMDEGVRSSLANVDGFTIDCDIDTSTISPHPGGDLYIILGPIRASLTEEGGDITIDGQSVASVAPQFHLSMRYINGTYTVGIDGRDVGSARGDRAPEAVFGFEHDSHYCELLSHAYVRDIRMQLAVGYDDPSDAYVETWE